MRQGNTLSLGDGDIFGDILSRDTLYVENNTFVDVGTYFMVANNDPRNKEKFIWINHNTIIMGKANFDSYTGKYQEYVTNNLMFNYSMHAMQNIWNVLYTKDGGPKYKWGCLINDDTLVADSGTSYITSETLPSTRKHFIEYNSNYRSQGFWDLVKYINTQPGWQHGYLQNFIPALVYLDSSRETRMYNDKTSFPYFFDNNNISDNNSDYITDGAEIKANDPQFVDQKIYTLTDSAIAWIKQSELQVWGYQASDPSTWPHYFYKVDVDDGNPTTWPRFNGAYTNTKLMTASIEKLPLGDLNWFPSAKAIWQANQAKIMNYILAENESQMNITSVKKENSDLPNEYNLSQNYPNPFNPTTVIKYSIAKSGSVTLKVYNMVGQEVATLVNQEQSAGNYSIDFNASRLASGVYMYRLNAGNFTATKKLILLK
jgi:hypothetical protein